MSLREVDALLALIDHPDVQTAATVLANDEERLAGGGTPERQPLLLAKLHLMRVARSGLAPAALEALDGLVAALSAGIRELESLIGVTLVERTRRVVRFTALGDRIVEKAHRVLRRLPRVAGENVEGDGERAKPVAQGGEGARDDEQGPEGVRGRGRGRGSQARAPGLVGRDAGKRAAEWLGAAPR